MQKQLAVLGMLAIVVLISWYAFFRNSPASETENVLPYFTQSLQNQAKLRVADYDQRGLGGGVDGFMLRELYSGLVPEDFEGARAKGGDYAAVDGELVYTGHAASDSGILTTEGFKTLLENLSTRLNMQIETTEDIDALLTNIEAYNPENEVRKTVLEFGNKLRMVPLLAPLEERVSAIKLHYGELVSPELLAEWATEDGIALGRYASNPWPQRITISSVRQRGQNFIVEGNVVEVTTSSSSEVAATYPITLEMEKRGENWIIIKVDKGMYAAIPHSQTIIGYWECLTPKNTRGPETMECALGIAVDQSDGHFALNTSLMSTYPVDFPTGTKLRVTGVVTPAEPSGKYDVDGVINATVIEKI